MPTEPKMADSLCANLDAHDGNDEQLHKSVVANNRPLPANFDDLVFEDFTTLSRGSDCTKFSQELTAHERGFYFAHQTLSVRQQHVTETKWNDVSWPTVVRITDQNLRNTAAQPPVIVRFSAAAQSQQFVNENSATRFGFAADVEFIEVSRLGSRHLLSKLAPCTDVLSRTSSD